MRYVSVDIETTGLSDFCQVIELGAVLDDTDHPNKPVEELPSFHTYILPPAYHGTTTPFFVGEAYALSMHSAIFKRFANQNSEENKRFSFLKEGEVFDAFLRWLQNNGVTGSIVAAGKNFAGFDKQFLKRLPQFDVGIFSHRTIDPALMFWKPNQDKELPSSKVCMERAGLSGEVAHTALEDALMVVKLVRAGLTQ